MTEYRIYEAYRNAGGGINGTNSCCEYVEADSAEEAAKAFFRDNLDAWGVDEDLVIVATDDNIDSFHYAPFAEGGW